MAGERNGWKRCGFGSAAKVSGVIKWQSGELFSCSNVAFRKICLSALYVRYRYSWWKGYFVESVRELESVKRTFRKGLDLMNQAMALGDDAKYRSVFFSLLSRNMSLT